MSAEHLYNMKKPTIAVDIDDVLAAYAEDWIAFSNQAWGTNLTVDDYHEHWAEVWGVDHENWKKRVAYYFDHADVSDLGHNEDAKTVLDGLSDRYEIVIVTSRRSEFKEDSLDWLNRHYGGIFQEIHFAGLWEELNNDTHLYTKADLVKQIGADYLIDDQLKHCIASAEVGIPALLFGNYAWNQTDQKLPDGVTRVQDWHAVQEFFDARR